MLSQTSLSYLKSQNAEYIDYVFEKYLADPDSIDPTWRYFFDGLELGAETALKNGSSGADASPQKTDGVSGGITSRVDIAAEAQVAELIEAYRALGKHAANINPLYPAPSAYLELDISKFGFKPADLDKTFSAGKLLGIGNATLKAIVEHLKNTYCSSIAVEVSHIHDPSSRKWLLEKMESSQNREALDAGTKKHIYRRLCESEGLERFLHTRYVAQKRFSIEGGESTIPALDCIIEKGAELGVKEVVLGMAHRGRLNVLVNVFGKKVEYLFSEFEGAYKVDTSLGEGDVKYHKGYSCDFVTRQGHEVHLSLASNPSHLEFVNPVVEGIARAKQDRMNDTSRSQVMPIIIHGDAAFAGQGVCYETLNLSQLRGYSTGGTVNIVINNQVGFTTDPTDSRSTPYSTDVAKMLDSPIFHVNGDDPEAVWYVCKLACEYRQKFKADVFIDIVCYRKHGHNEGDEPAFTQPILYKKIKGHTSTREKYANLLTQSGVMSSQEIQTEVDMITENLSEAQTRAKTENPTPTVSVFEGAWRGLRVPKDDETFATVKTCVDRETLTSLSEQLNTVPKDFHLHSKLGRFFDARLKAVKDGVGIDWGNAETLAFASLLNEGHSIRLSGQDVERGTFSHRNCTIHDIETGALHIPLNHLQKQNNAVFHVSNSSLSETGVLGFEYGYSLAAPHTLTIWEAQFGDFANGTQVIIDQFIASAESKWRRMSGITLLLPHSYEGQGPEHSSARLERFLQLCGRNNMIVCNLTTPSQIFHALRRQLKRDFRKPLVIMSPKSLLRHPKAVSKIEDLTQGVFYEVLDDPMFSGNNVAAKRVLLCSGKVYYDLIAERSKKGRDQDVAIIRMEQLYPWPGHKLALILEAYKNAEEIVWVQEEPRNMGAWSYVFNMWAGGFEDFSAQVGGRLIRYVGRQVGAAPAVGSHKVHEQEQEALLSQAFGDL